MLIHARELLPRAGGFDRGTNEGPDRPDRTAAGALLRYTGNGDSVIYVFHGNE